MKGKRYNEILFLGTHNSYSNPFPYENKHEFTLKNKNQNNNKNNNNNRIINEPFKDCVLNQHLSIKEQLESGVTMLDIEVHMDDFLSQRLIVCHGPPMFSGWTGRCNLEDVLSVVCEFTAKNPEKLLTVYINTQGLLDNFGWANTQIIKTFQDSGLDRYVFSYNEKRRPDKEWPLVETMLAAKRPVMVFGLNGLQNYKNYQNFIINQDDFNSNDEDIELNEEYTVKEAWRAKDPKDLGPNRLYINLETEANRLFCLNVFASPRRFWTDRPFLFGGNPRTAEIVNSQCVIPLYTRAQKTLALMNQRVNWIWLDFWRNPSQDPGCKTLLEFVEAVNNHPLSSVSTEQKEKEKEICETLVDEAMAEKLQKELFCDNYKDGFEVFSFEDADSFEDDFSAEQEKKEAKKEENKEENKEEKEKLDVSFEYI